jgi:hypothetical protein
MTGRDVSEYDMPDFPWRADRAVPPVGDGALDELLTARQPPQDAAAGLQPVAAVLAALRAGSADGEHAGHARALAEFRNTIGASRPAGRSRARRPALLRRRLSSKLALITAAAAVAVSGTAAAYVGALPGPLQRAAHDVIAAPAVGAAHSRGVPAAVGARPFPARSAAAPRSPATGNPGGGPGQAGSAGKHHRHRRHGHHEGRKAWWADRHAGMRGIGHDDWPTARRDDNPMAHYKGMRLRLPLPPAAAFPIPPAGPGRPGPGGR